MWLYRTLTISALSLKCCSSKYGLSGVGITRWINFLPVKKNFDEISRLSGLTSSLVFTRCLTYRTRKQKRPDPPCDFLPFPWKRKKKFCYIEGSGDSERTLDVDRKLSKDDLDLSKFLEGLDENLRRLFSLETCLKNELLEIHKQILLRKVQQHPMDFDSTEVQIALKTLRVRSLMQHFKEYPREKRGKVMLIQAIQKRNRMLKYLRDVDMPRFEWIIEELGIEYTPKPLGTLPVRYTRKNELRRLTREYCDKILSEKRAAYHAELKEQQQLFLKEKEEILAWIAKEEKDLGIANSPVS